MRTVSKTLNFATLASVGASRGQQVRTRRILELSHNFSEEEPMRKFVYALALSSMVLPAFAPPAEAITEDEAHAIGVEAYLYFYSPITMDLTRKQLTNQEPTRAGSAAR